MPSIRIGLGVSRTRQRQTTAYDPLDWILATGLWDDTNIWVNSAVWID